MPWQIRLSGPLDAGEPASRPGGWGSQIGWGRVIGPPPSGRPPLIGRPDRRISHGLVAAGRSGATQSSAWRAQAAAASPQASSRRDAPSCWEIAAASLGWLSGSSCRQAPASSCPAAGGRGSGQPGLAVVSRGTFREGRKLVGERRGLSLVAAQPQIVHGRQHRSLPLGWGGGKRGCGQQVVGCGSPRSRRGLLASQRGNLGGQLRVWAAGRCHLVAQGGGFAFNELGGAGMQAGPPGRAEVMVDGRTDERVGEGDQPLDGSGMVAEQVSGGCLLEGFQRVGDLAKAAGERQGAAGAEH